MNKILIKYLRDENKVPVVVIVGTADHKVGISICSPKDHCVKKEGIARALKRTQFVSGHIPANTTWDRNVLEAEMENMLDRTHRYFKETVEVQRSSTMS